LLKSQVQVEQPRVEGQQLEQRQAVERAEQLGEAGAEVVVLPAERSVVPEVGVEGEEVVVEEEPVSTQPQIPF
jgi:hypothetical protein